MGCRVQPALRVDLLELTLFMLVTAIACASIISCSDANASYTVTYDTDGGSDPIPEQHYESGMTFYLPTYSGHRIGYDFSGWTDGESQFLPNVSYVMPDHDLVFRAVWTPITYYVVFDPNGGIGDQITIKTRYDVEMPNYSQNFSLTGYTMGSWNTNADGSGKMYPATGNLKNLASTDMEYVTLYAQWVPNTYKVTYLFDDSPGAESYIETATYDDNYTLKDQTFTKTGHTQQGWTDTLGGQAVYPLGYIIAKWNIDGDITLYPTWETNTYTLSFVANGGSGEMAPIKEKYGKEVSIPDCIFTFKDHSFDAWNTKADGTGTKYTPGSGLQILEDTVLYAQWFNLFTLRYDLTGGTGDFPQQSVETYDKSTVIDIYADIPVFEGHRFVCWGSSAVSPEHTYAPGSSITLTEDTPSVIIYAQWEDAFYMSFDPMGGTGSPSTQVGYSQKSFTFTIPDVIPVKAGHSFSGWSASPGSSASYQPGAKIVLDKQHSITLYAVWSVETTYSVSYSANGGTDAPETQYLKSSLQTVTMTLSDISPSRSGYDFDGWTLTPGEAASYHPGGTIVLKATDSSTILYAVWSGGSVTADGVEITFAPKIVTVGSSVKLKAVVHPENATQGEPVWSSSDRSKARITSNGILTGISAGTVTITAKADSAFATVQVRIAEPVNVIVGVEDNITTVENVTDVIQDIESAKEAETPISFVVTSDTEMVEIDPKIIESLKEFDNSQMVISKGDCELIIPSSALKSVPQAESDITFLTRLIDSPEEYTHLGGDKCIELTVMVDGVVQSMKFDDRVIVKMAYDLAEGEDPDYLEVLYVDGNDGAEIMKGAFYDAGMVWFTTDHFSLYMVKFNMPSSSDDWWWIVAILLILLIILLILLLIALLYWKTDSVDRLVEDTPMSYVYSRMIANKNAQRQRAARKNP